MKLRNKKTGEIGNLALNINPNRESYSVLSTENGDTVCGNLVIADYNSLAELNEEWEDAPEEPKKYWYITGEGDICRDDIKYSEWIEERKSIGNYFETKEEAEKAVEKLKAWKRLKDKGFRFKYWTYKMDEPKIENHTHFMIVGVCEDGVRFDDLDLLFGGEE